MVKYSDKTNLLEENVYKYMLQDVDEPNLYREMFGYTTVPKITFNNRHVPPNMPSEIWITDTTFRDGQQSRSPFTVKQIVDLYKLMSRLGGKKGIIRQSEFFVYTENDRRALQQCMDLGLEFPEVTTWIRASEKDFDLVKEIGIKETGILVSCSDYHIFKKMNLTRAQAMDKYLAVVKMALDKGIRPRCHFEDITRADFYGFVVPFANELMNLSKSSGIPIKVRACDTLGFGVSLPGVSLPRSVPGIIYGLTHHAEIPSEWLEWHGHNDFYKVVSNASAAWLYGCSAVNCALLGIGERTGNCPLEAMAVEYVSFRGTTDGMDLTAITDIANYFEKEINYDIPPRTPFVAARLTLRAPGFMLTACLRTRKSIIYSTRPQS
jgi:isopropylmalate/homocitrate/citramalate synthase